MKYYYSQAFKIHKALPESRYIFNIDMEDQLPEKDEDIYRVESFSEKWTVGIQFTDFCQKCIREEITNKTGKWYSPSC